MRSPFCNRGDLLLTIQVINNAAVALDGFNGQIVMDTMKINYYGTIAAMNAFLPLFRAEGRLVNVSSSAGKLHHLTPATAKRFTSANTIKDVTSIVQDFQDAVDAGRQEEAGFKSAAYLNSKVALNAATRIIAREQSEKGNKVLINCCNPGYVNVSADYMCRLLRLLMMSLRRICQKVMVRRHRMQVLRRLYTLRWVRLVAVQGYTGTTSR